MTEAKILWYRRLFIAAGVYNILWGVFSAVYPQWLFDWADLSQLNHPQIFQCLAMVVGIYGLLYFEAARSPIDGFAIIALGFLGKFLGPVGWLQLYLTDVWPLKSMVLIITNDLIWWIPFIFYLKETWPRYKASWGADSNK